MQRDSDAVDKIGVSVGVRERGDIVEKRSQMP